LGKEEALHNFPTRCSRMLDKVTEKERRKGGFQRGGEGGGGTAHYHPHLFCIAGPVGRDDTHIAPMTGKKGRWTLERKERKKKKEEDEKERLEYALFSHKRKGKEKRREKGGPIEKRKKAIVV